MNRTTTLATLTILAFMALLDDPAAHAVDGVVEINMAAALLGEITPDDTPGLPVTLSEEGSYRLTGNLETASAHGDVIEITASFVTLDLNGFTVSGPGTAGSGNGIGSAVTLYHTTVRNGIVRGMGSGGLRLLGPYSRVGSVEVRQNQDDGMQLGINGVVRDCIASTNGDIGIVVSTGGSVHASAASQNGFASGFATGISIGNGGSAIDNTSRANVGEGIVAGRGATIRGNTLYENSEDGIRAGEGSLVVDNAARDNDGVGLDLGVNSGYGGNVLTNNSLGPVSAASSFQIKTNVCGTNTSC